MTDQAEPFLVIDRLPRPTIVLPKKSDAAAFLETEERVWAWANQPLQEGPGSIRNRLSQYRPDEWVPGFRQALGQSSADQFFEAMRRRFGNEQALCGLDPESHALHVLSQMDSFVAAVALATIHGEAPVNDPNFLRNNVRNRIGIAHGTALLAGLDRAIIDGTKHELVEMRAAIDLEAQQMRALIDDYRVASEKNSEEIKTAAHALGDAHEAAFSKAESERAEGYKKLHAELEATLRTFEVRMQLQAPVAYWKKRAAEYRKAANWSLAILILFSMASVAGLYWLYERAASHLPTDSTTVPYAALFRASTFALLMTSIALWAGRVILRIHLSARHLTTDAEERRTMITTFLALTRKASVSEEDRKFILAALFRPGTDGIVKEESAPDTMFAALMGSILKR